MAEGRPDVSARSDQLRRLLDGRIRPLEGVADIRLCGLMGGVDAVGGPDRGRQVCAAVVGAGVLLRRLGNTVVLMPPLTVTEVKMERIVGVLAAAIADG